MSQVIGRELQTAAAADLKQLLALSREVKAGINTIELLFTTAPGYQVSRTVHAFWPNRLKCDPLIVPSGRTLGVTTP